MDTAIADQRSNECMVVTPTVAEAKAAMFYLSKYLAKVPCPDRAFCSHHSRHRP